MVENAVFNEISPFFCVVTIVFNFSESVVCKSMNYRLLVAKFNFVPLNNLNFSPNLLKKGIFRKMKTPDTVP